MASELVASGNWRVLRSETGHSNAETAKSGARSGPQCTVGANLHRPWKCGNYHINPPTMRVSHRRHAKPGAAKNEGGEPSGEQWRISVPIREIRGSNSQRERGPSACVNLHMPVDLGVFLGCSYFLGRGERWIRADQMRTASANLLTPENRGVFGLFFLISCRR